METIEPPQGDMPHDPFASVKQNIIREQPVVARAMMRLTPLYDPTEARQGQPHEVQEFLVWFGEPRWRGDIRPAGDGLDTVANELETNLPRDKKTRIWRRLSSIAHRLEPDQLEDLLTRGINPAGEIDPRLLGRPAEQHESPLSAEQRELYLSAIKRLLERTLVRFILVIECWVKLVLEYIEASLKKYSHSAAAGTSSPGQADSSIEDIVRGSCRTLERLVLRRLEKQARELQINSPPDGFRQRWLDERAASLADRQRCRLRHTPPAEVPPEQWRVMSGSGRREDEVALGPYIQRLGPDPYVTLACLAGQVRAHCRAMAEDCAAWLTAHLRAHLDTLEIMPLLLRIESTRRDRDTDHA